MLSTLPPHPRAVDASRPTAAYLDTYIMRDATGHWFWDDNRSTHRHNQLGHAIVAAYANSHPGRRAKKGERGTFCVARLLLEARYCGLPPRTRIACACGLPQCINPSHWDLTFPAPRYHLRSLGGVDWELTVLRHKNAKMLGRPAVISACVHVSDGPLVHFVVAVPGQPLVARCGHVVDVSGASSALVVTRLPTCEGCRS